MSNIPIIQQYQAERDIFLVEIKDARQEAREVRINNVHRPYHLELARSCLRNAEGALAWMDEGLRRGSLPDSLREPTDRLRQIYNDTQQLLDTSIQGAKVA